MANKKLIYPFNELSWGLAAPIEALRFLAKKKLVLALLVVLYLAFFALYLFIVSKYVMPLSQNSVNSLQEAVTSSFLRTALTYAIKFSFGIVAFLLFPLVGVPLLNVIASPIFDWISHKSFEEFSGIKVPGLSFKKSVRSLLFELVRFVLIAGLFILTVISWIYVIFIPFVIVFSLWFFDWDAIDRTLGLLGFGMRKRLAFGILHFIACISLGVWSFVPLFGSLLAFTTVSAGGILTAKLISSKDKLAINS